MAKFSLIKFNIGTNLNDWVWFHSDHLMHGLIFLKFSKVIKDSEYLMPRMITCKNSNFFDFIREKVF